MRHIETMELIPKISVLFFVFRGFFCLISGEIASFLFAHFSFYSFIISYFFEKINSIFLNKIKNEPKEQCL